MPCRVTGAIAFLALVWNWLLPAPAQEKQEQFGAPAVLELLTPPVRKRPPMARNSPTRDS